MDGRGSVVPEALELTGPYLFRGESRDSKSIVERNLFVAPLHSLQCSKPFFNIGDNEGGEESGQNRLAFLIEQIQKKNHIENAPNPTPSFVEPCIESRPCLSPSVADHPLGPATDHRLGKLLPHQLANQTRAPPRADSSFCSSAYGVLAAVSSCCSPPKGRFLRVTHPSATGNTTSRPTCMLNTCKSNVVLLETF
ncbi:hypothetical protein ACH5RR_001063 [Cinchona calisaya]|uniref:Uncharacterized protein n=1 Tax=Cinchona calisaya TaxID=153742 RepID=A0ABD3B2C7_9GENT